MVDIDIDLSPVLLDVVGSLSDASIQGNVRKVLRKTQERTTISYSLHTYTYIQPVVPGQTDQLKVNERLEDVHIGDPA